MAEWIAARIESQYNRKGADAACALYTRYTAAWPKYKTGVDAILKADGYESVTG